MPLVQLANGPLSAAGPVEDEALDDLENVPPGESRPNSGLCSSVMIHYHVIFKHYDVFQS